MYFPLFAGAGRSVSGGLADFGAVSSGGDVSSSCVLLCMPIDCTGGSGTSNDSGVRALSWLFRGVTKLPLEILVGMVNGSWVGDCDIGVVGTE